MSKHEDLVRSASAVLSLQKVVVIFCEGWVRLTLIFSIDMKFGYGKTYKYSTSTKELAEPSYVKYKTRMEKKSYETICTD